MASPEWGMPVPLNAYYVVELSAEGQAVTRIDLHCESVEDAKERAKHLVQDKPVELWEGSIRIARFYPMQ